MTINKMVRLYCRLNHPDSFCDDCRSLLEYAEQRVQQCSFKAGMLVCSQCSVHCFEPDKRQRVRQVMKTIGPKMLFYHPVLSLFYLRDKIGNKIKKWMKK